MPYPKSGDTFWPIHLTTIAIIGYAMHEIDSMHGTSTIKPYFAISVAVIHPELIPSGTVVMAGGVAKAYDEAIPKTAANAAAFTLPLAIAIGRATVHTIVTVTILDPIFVIIPVINIKINTRAIPDNALITGSN